MGCDFGNYLLTMISSIYSLSVQTRWHIATPAPAAEERRVAPWEIHLTLFLTIFRWKRTLRSRYILVHRPHR